MLRSDQMLIESQIQGAETKRNLWRATIPHTNTKEDIFKPEFFTNIAHRLTVGDMIECVAEDGTYFLEVYVTAVAEKTATKNANWANVVELRYVDLVKPEDKHLELPKGFTAKWRGGARWSIIRVGASEADNQVVVERQATRADAIREFEKLKNKMVA